MGETLGKRQISITIDSELLDIIDQIVNTTGYSRSEIINHFIRKAIRDYIEYYTRLSTQKKKAYDIIDRIIDDTIRKAFGDQE